MIHIHKLDLSICWRRAIGEEQKYKMERCVVDTWMDSLSVVTDLCALAMDSLVILWIGTLLPPGFTCRRNHQVLLVAPSRGCRRGRHPNDCCVLFPGLGRHSFYPLVLPQTRCKISGLTRLPSSDFWVGSENLWALLFTRVWNECCASKQALVENKVKVKLLLLMVAALVQSCLY